MENIEFINKLFKTHTWYEKSQLSPEFLGDVAPAFKFKKYSESFYYRYSTFELKSNLLLKLEINDLLIHSTEVETSFISINFIVSGNVTGTINGEKVNFNGSDTKNQNFILTGDCDVELKFENVILISLFYNYVPIDGKIDSRQLLNQLEELIGTYFKNREAFVTLACRRTGYENVLNLLTVVLDVKIFP